MPLIVRRLWRIPLAALSGAGLLLVPTGGRALAATTPTWSQLSPSVGPPALRDAAAAYDGANRTVVVFGGARSDGTLSDQTWVWNGSTWSHADVYGAMPAPRQRASMAFDPALNQLILFGGAGAGGRLYDDTWAWNGASWNEIDAGPGPGGREGAALAADTAGHLVLFGGYGTSASARAGGAVTPTTTASSSTTTTPRGTGNKASTTTTEAGPTTTTTTTTRTTRTVPPAPDGPAVLGDTWVLGGDTGGADRWDQVAAGVAPPPAVGASMTYTGSTTVMFGGSSLRPGVGDPAGLSDETWTWSGTAWRQVDAKSRPSARQQPAAGYDADLGEIVLFGGAGAAGPLGDTWAYRSGAWNQLTVATPPTARSGAAAAYDSASRQFVVFGGSTAQGTTVGETQVLTKAAPPDVVTGPSSPTTTPGTAAGSVPGSTSRPTRPSGSRSGGSRSGGSRSSGSRSGGSPSGGSRSGGSRPTAPTTPGRRSAPGLTVTTTTLHRGDVVRLRGSGFLSHARVTITFHSVPAVVVATTRADSDGRFFAAVTVPVDAAMGYHRFIAAGRGPRGTTTLVTDVRVVALAIRRAAATTATATLTLIAVAIPVLTWIGLGIASRRRRDNAAGA
jgi:hypothetical protein